MNEIIKFSALIRKDSDRDSTYIEVPFEVRSKFETKRIKVHVTIDDETFDCILNLERMPFYKIEIHKDINAQIGKQPGSNVYVTLKLFEPVVDDVSVDEYIAQFPQERQNLLNCVRATIKENAPECTEKICWGMPTYYKEKYMVGFANAKKHIGFYPGANAIIEFSDLLKNFKTSKGAIQFPVVKPIPYEIIAQITRFRYIADNNAENEK